MAKVITDESKINEVFGRNIEAVFPSVDKAKEIFKSGRRLTFYLGIDPTGPDIHLGHTTNLFVLKKLISLGHKVILLIGDFTAQTGDPTGKDTARKSLSVKEVEDNMKTYIKQVIKILPKGSFELKYNSKWLGKLTFNEIRKLARQVTVQQMITRDMFQRRLTENKPISLEEFLYPLMQGYDSVAMNVDGEIGGNDQTFNMLAGRTLMKEMLQKEKFVMATKLLVDATGKKMGKTENNMVTLADSADDMYGKIMSWPDGLILPGFELLTDVALIDVEEGLKKGDNPRDWKARLAQEVVAFFHSKKAARAAQRNFENLFREHETPTEVPVYQTDKEKINILDLLVESGLVMSKGEARRLMDGGGIYMNNETLKDYNLEVAPTAEGILLQKGKRFFVRVVKK